MSSSEAQRSPVHHATEDSNVEPTGPAKSAATPGADARATDAGVSSGGASSAGTPGADARQAADLKSRPDGDTGAPGNFERGAAMAGRRPDSDDNANPPGATNVIGGGPGVGDASSGGGAGAGVPGGGTDIRTGGAFNTGDPDEDRKRLFPEASSPQRPGGKDDTAIGKDPDESTYGGPLNLDDPDAV